jgi:chemotaxis protein CheC
MICETAPSPAQRLEMLRQLFAAATHDASAAMCRWTDGLINLSLDEVREIDLLEVCAEVGIDDQQLTMVVLRIDGRFGGEMLLVFDEEQGRRLAAAMLACEPISEGPWTDVEKSVLTETGNILGCTYLNALARLLGEELVPTPPYFLQDYGASVLQQALVSQAGICDKVLVCRTNFHSSRGRLDWQVLFVPNEGMRSRLESVCGTPADQ